MTMDDESRRILGNLIAAGDHERAAAHAAALIDKHPHDPVLLAFLGGVLLELGRAGDSVAYLDRALAIEPDHLDARYNLALARNALGDFPHAAENYRQVLKLQPDHAGAFNNLCHVLTELHEFDVHEAASALRGAYKKFFSKHPEFSVKASPTISLARWCAAQGHAMHNLDAPEEVTVTDRQSGATVSYQTDGVRFVVVPQATLITLWDFAIAPTGQVLEDSGYHDLGFVARVMPHISNRARATVVYACPVDRIEIAEDALFLSAPPDMAFGHWLMQFLPRLRAWKSSGLTAMKVAAPADLPQHQRDTLAAFGVGAGDIIWCEFGKRYRFKSLTVVQTGDPYRPGPANIRFLYNALGPPGTAGKMHRRFFLARSGTARGRNVVNQEELDKTLAEFDFEVMRRPEVPLHAQNAAMAETKVVVTVHGTDMTAFLQLRPGAHLILLCFEDLEPLERELGSLAMTSMCQMLGIHFHRFLCTPTKPPRQGKAYYRDLTVDCAALRTYLDDILNPRSAKP